ncbi:MAG: T9SS type A sorting domain-containing protein [Balneola sp.]|nr:T9SS type A sorting domain-containing protein [Balneola sp.]MBO6650931.1 T9SS type A sorting domain-containing protein [Balneola sp.]MBO6711873.1 T9SS type A sorting domain-containing protein [Balneola sp.]MBO6800068.1 T9SS type A sorting domain-containing protein [Balneola sp.]MBO6871551.1 T9SS type A sorting domain-containing protein [Balneola sp.]
MKLRYFYFLLLFQITSTIGSLAQAPPQQVEPEDNAQDQPTELTFSWLNVQDADVYQIQISENPNFEPVFLDETTSETSIQASGLSNSTEYFWRVRSGSFSLLGTSYGEWSSVRGFITVVDKPDAPVLVSPQNGSSEISIPVNLRWDSVSYASEYNLQVSLNSDFSTNSFDSIGIMTTEISVDNLMYNKNYFWRVKSINKAGESSWSVKNTFQTQSQPLLVPELESPTDNKNNVSTNVTLHWNSVSGADSYDFQVATDENFIDLITNQQDVTSLQYPANLESDTKYFWRVRAKNETETTNWSDVWSFSTVVENNSISILSPAGKVIWDAGKTYSIRWNTTNRVNAVDIFYKIGQNGEWQQISTNVPSSDNRYNWEVPEIQSERTYIKISDSERTDITNQSNSFIVYPNTVNLELNSSFPSNPGPLDYKLIGLPMAENYNLENVFEGKYGEDWRAFYDNGKAEDFLIEYSDSEPFQFQPGKGFWVIASKDLDLNNDVPSKDLNVDSTLTIPLQQGWNIISNPFWFTISWSSVIQKNNLNNSDGINTTLWNFDQTFDGTSAFEPYKAYYYFNELDLSELKIPLIPFTTTNNSKLKNTYSADKEFKVSLNTDQAELSSIKIIYDPNLNGKVTPLQYAPPTPFSENSISIVPDIRNAENKYPIAKVLMPEIQSASFIDFEIRNNKDGFLKIEGKEVFDDYSIKLINVETDTEWDLSNSEEIHLDNSASPKNFRLIVGEQSYVEEEIENFIPSQVQLSQNYPNPFNGQTVIKYSIPQNGKQANVSLEIFNILGQKVITLLNKKQEAGNYEVKWDAKNSAGSAVSTGVYYYRLIVNNSVYTRSLTYLK